MEKNPWFFPVDQISVVTEQSEERVHILLDNNQTANVPLAGVRTIKDDETSEMIGILVKNGKIRKTIRSVKAIC